eukprot:9507417-Prorocentrum_lima.AAC.1
METNEMMEQRAKMKRDMEMLREEMEIIRQHNIAVDCQRDRGEWSFYGNPPGPSRETQHVGGVPEVEGASLRRPPAD